MKKMSFFGVFMAISIYVMDSFSVAPVSLADEGVVPALPVQCIGTYDNVIDIALGGTPTGDSDFIFAGDGNIAIIDGGNGNDCILVGNNNMARIIGGNGDDVVIMGVSNQAKIEGNNGGDLMIVGNTNSGEINGEDENGNDLINIGTNNSGTIFSGNGADITVVGENNSGNVFGGNGNDTIAIGYWNTGEINGGLGTNNIIYIPPAPSADPLPGTFNSVQDITLSSDGAESIFFTIDGTIPNCNEENGEIYESSLSVSETETISAIACAEEGYGSPVASFVYVVEIIDVTAPTVTKIGDDSTDVVLGIGDTNLLFDEVLSDGSKTAVENALTAGADKTLTYVWSGASLIITATEETTFTNDVMVNVSDVAGNSAYLLSVDSALTSSQKAPDSDGVAIIDSITTQVVITNPTQEVNITISDGTVNPTIDVSSFISGGTGTLPEINITSANANNANVAIPASTIVISADSAWNGIITAPTIATVELPEISGETKTLSIAIEVGFTDAKLSFDKAVRILLSGQAGKRAGYVRTGTAFTEITNTCATDNQATGDALIVDGDCKIDVGGDLVIWTKHFTTFATYSQISTPTQASSGGGGGRGIGDYINGPLASPTPQPILKIVTTPAPILVVTPNITATPNPKIIQKIAKASTLTPTVTPLVSQQTLQKATIFKNIGHAVVSRVEKIGTWLFGLIGIKSK